MFHGKPIASLQACKISVYSCRRSLELHPRSGGKKRLSCVLKVMKEGRRS